MDFTYESTISGEELRLLTPTSLTRFALDFTVLTVPRRPSPQYTTVSYVWGKDEASELIYLNGQAFRVRPNLWSCLYYLGLAADRAGTGGGCRYLWVDAICINQSDAAERNAQIRRMDQTYRRAAYVSVWLGLPTVPGPLMPHCLESVKTIEVEPFQWVDCIADLANRPYWSRFWVIQEFLLGQDILLYCSNSRVDWESFRTILCREAGGPEWDSEFGTAEPSARTLSYRALPLVMNRHDDKFPSYLQPLHYLLIRHQRAEFRDPRDRVFALLGLVTPEGRRLLERFFPDYTMSQEHVCVIRYSGTPYAVLHVNSSTDNYGRFE